MSAKWRMFAWIDPDQAAMLGDVVASAGVQLMAIGSPDATVARDVAGQFGCDAVDDLRHGLEQSAGTLELIWLASSEPLDSSLHSVAARVGCPLMTIEPRPDSTASVLKQASLGGLFQMTPLMAVSAGARAARSLLPEFGAVQCLSVSMCSGATDGSIRARLFDALHVSSWLCGEAVEISAANHESIDGRQWLTANVTFEMGRSAAIAIHQGGDVWSRQVIAHGGDATLVMTDSTCTCVDGADDALWRPAPPTSVSAQIAGQIQQMQSGRKPVEQPVEQVRVLALCDAAMLGCRTRQVETPGRMLQALAGP